MKRLLILLSFASNVHAAAHVESQSLKCGMQVLVFTEGGDRVQLGGRTFDVDWSDDGADGLFDGHHVQVSRANQYTLDGVACAAFQTSW